MNTPEEEQITYIAVEPAKSSRIQSINTSQLVAGDPSSGNLDKVRDLLFGNQVRDLDKKFNRLEERLSKECDKLREDTKKRLDSLEIYIKQEVESLAVQVVSAQAEELKD